MAGLTREHLGISGRTAVPIEYYNEDANAFEWFRDWLNRRTPNIPILMPVARAVGNLGSGIIEGVGDLGLLFIDLGWRAPFTDDELDGFWNTIWTRWSQRSGEFVSDVLGFEDRPGFTPGGLGGLIMPVTTEGFRRRAGEILGFLGDNINELYTFTVGDLVADVAIELNAIYQLLRGRISIDEYTDYTAEAHRARGDDPDLSASERWRNIGIALSPFHTDEEAFARTLSPGQTAFLGMVGARFDNPEDFNRWVGTPQYFMVSGLFDAALQIAASPDVLLGRAGHYLKIRNFSRPVNDLAAINRALAPGSFYHEVIKPKLGNVSDVELYMRYFRDLDAGGEIAHLLNTAGPDKADDLMRWFLGDEQAGYTLFRGPSGEDLRETLNRYVDYVYYTEDELASLPFFSVREMTRSDFVPIDHSLDLDRALLESRMERLHGVLRQEQDFANAAPIGGRMVPSLTGLRREIAWRTRYPETIQTSVFRPLVRVGAFLASRRTNHILLVEEASSVEMVRRQLRDSGMPVGQQDQLLNRYIAAGTPEARAAAYEYIEDQIFQHIASGAGIDSEALNTILNQIRDERMRSWGIINDTVRHRIYDSEGRGVIRYTDEFGEQHEYALPLYITQTANVIPMVDLDLVKKATTKWGRRRLTSTAWNFALRGAEDITKAWKYSVLLRPAWATRTFLLDEHLRALARLGAFVRAAGQRPGAAIRGFYADMFGNGFHNLMVRESDAVRRLFNRNLPDRTNWPELPARMFEGEFTGPIFHGTSQRFEGDILDQMKEDPYSLFGPGFYVTDSPQVARSYQAKDATPDGDPITYRVHWTEDRPPNILDLEGEVTPELMQALRDFWGDLREEVVGLHWSLENRIPRTLNSLIFSETDLKAGELLNSVRADLDTIAGLVPHSVTGEVALSDVWQRSLRDHLRDAGYDAMRYDGGKRIPHQGIKHNAFVVLNEDALRIEPLGKYEELSARLAEALAPRALKNTSARTPGFRWAYGRERISVDSIRGEFGDGIVRDMPVTPLWNPTDATDMTQMKISSANAFHHLMGREYRDLLGRLRNRDDWRVILPDAENYYEEWGRRVFLQIGQDPIAAGFARGRFATPEDALYWLKTSREGRQYLARVHQARFSHLDWEGSPFLARGEEYDDVVLDWLRDVEAHVEQYTAGRHSDIIRQLETGENPEDFAEFMSRLDINPSDLPAIHGEALRQIIGLGGPVFTTLSRIVNDLFTMIGTLPTDALLREPFANAVYKAEVRRRADLLIEQRGARSSDLLINPVFTQSDLRRIEDAAREVAIQEVRETLFDLSQQGQFAHMLRFIGPFYGAFEEAAAKWTGLALENPALLARARQIWEAPERMAMQWEDDEGNQYLSLVPEWAQTLVPDSLRIVKDISFRKDQLNMILEGPGYSPWVTIPASELVKDKPELEEALRFVLPFGPRSWLEEILPTWARNVVTLAQEEDNRAYLSVMQRIWAAEMVNYETNRRDDPPTYEEIRDKTRSYFMLRIVAGSTLPASPNAESPYRGHLDTLRRFREEDPTTADQRFLEEFGEEYFALVQSVSDGTRGVPPTVEGMERWEQFQDLINQAPELGGWIIGEEGAGEFSRAIFNAQFDTPVEPGSSEMLRELSGGPADWDQERLRRLGWYEYSRQMELIEAARVMMGIPNYQVAAAEPLRQVKRLVVEDIRRRFSLDDGRSPWYEDYTTPDFDKQRRRFNVFRQVIDHPDLRYRPDVQGLSTYIRVREVFAMELLRRKQTGGASTMEAAANLDLRYLWETVVLDLLNDNPAFADMYHRFLEFDVPEASDVEEVISA